MLLQRFAYFRRKFGVAIVAGGPFHSLQVKQVSLYLFINRLPEFPVE
jgi:hypothetical protein